MTSQEKRLANATRECGEAIKAGVRPSRAIARVARAYEVPWRDIDGAMLNKRLQAKGDRIMYQMLAAGKKQTNGEG